MLICSSILKFNLHHTKDERREIQNDKLGISVPLTYYLRYESQLKEEAVINSNVFILLSVTPVLFK